VNVAPGRAARAGHRDPRDPIFLLSPARSYSTVSLALLAGHPDLYGFPELLIFSGATVGDLLAARPTTAAVSAWEARKLSGVLRAVAEVHDGVQDSSALVRARAWLTEHADWSTTALLDHLLAAVHPRIGLEKSPDTIAADDRVAACLRAYPQARILHLTRHPTGTIASMYRHWGSLPQMADPDLARACAGIWTTEHRRILRFAGKLPDERYLRVRSEDLLLRPRAELTRILGWLGLDATDPTIDAMQRTDRWRFAGFGPDGNLYGGDATFFGAPTLRRVPEPGPVVFDPAWRLTPAMRGRVSALAESLGY
jgi:Sulfotransferase family